MAILARDRVPVLVRSRLPGAPKDIQARYIEAAVNGILIASLYLPNGNPQPGSKFDYKLAWFERLIAHTRCVGERLLRAIAEECFHISQDIRHGAGWRSRNERAAEHAPRQVTPACASGMEPACCSDAKRRT